MERWKNPPDGGWKNPSTPWCGDERIHPPADGWYEIIPAPHNGGWNNPSTPPPLMGDEIILPPLMGDEIIPPMIGVKEQLLIPGPLLLLNIFSNIQCFTLKHSYVDVEDVTRPMIGSTTSKAPPHIPTSVVISRIYSYCHSSHFILPAPSMCTALNFQILFSPSSVHSTPNTSTAHNFIFTVFNHGHKLGVEGLCHQMISCCSV